MPGEVKKSLCADCQTVEADLEVRKRRLCRDCFDRYVTSKVLKKMVSYRFKNQVGDQRKRLFLPLAGGVSSLVLLQVLDAHVSRQLAQQNRAAYDLIIAHVCRPDTSIDTDRMKEWRSAVQSRFPSHEFLPLISLHDVFEYDPKVEADLRYLGIERVRNESNSDFTIRLLSSVKSVTSQTDLEELLLRRLLISIAKKNECESIIWAHSDSRLAAKALAEVAKGRGGAVPNALADGPSPLGINFDYPLRELFKTELEQYLQLPHINLGAYLLDEGKDDGKTPISIRNTSIDALLSSYINSQGEKYPSIMANVVRTASKLQVPTAQDGRPCQLCSMPVTMSSDSLCYGCARMKEDITI